MNLHMISRVLDYNYKYWDKTVKLDKIMFLFLAVVMI